MTTTIRPETPAAVSFQSPTVFWPVVVGTVAVTAIAALVSPTGWWSVGVVVAVIAVLGIPHGAVDLLVVDAIDGPSSGTSPLVIGAYLLAMGAVAAVWLVAPGVALAGFVGLSVHHFGQSDLAYLGLPGRRQLTVQWSRGLLLIGLPLIAHLPTISPFVERLGVGDPSSWPWLADLWWLWCAAIVVQHLAVGAMLAPGLPRDVVTREAATVAVLTVMFLTVDPLVGFAVYFGLWHSLAHILVLARVVGTGSNPVRSVARQAAPLTAVAVGFLALVAGVAAATDRLDLLVPLVFVFVSMLTLPHMVVVEQLWRRP